MEQTERVILVVASRLLSYPGETLLDDKQAIKECVDEMIEPGNLQDRLRQSYEPLFRLEPKQLRELYVSTFDLTSKLGPYLTAHELGDSVKRGAALIKLQKMVNQAGFEREEGELSDYMPMLLEFLTVAPDTKEVERLYRRLAVAFQRMLNNINEENPYRTILEVLMQYVFPEPSDEEVAQLEFDRDEADLEELPYPIMYQ